MSRTEVAEYPLSGKRSTPSRMSSARVAALFSSCFEGRPAAVAIRSVSHRSGTDVLDHGRSSLAAASNAVSKPSP